MKALITAHPIAIGLLAGAALIAIFGTPVEAYDRGNSRADGFSSSCCDGPHGLTLVRSKRPMPRAYRVAWNSGTRTGSGTSTGSGSRFLFDPKSGTFYLIVIQRSYEVDHSTRDLCGGCTAPDPYWSDPNNG